MFRLRLQTVQGEFLAEWFSLVGLVGSLLHLLLLMGIDQPIVTCFSFPLQGAFVSWFYKCKTCNSVFGAFREFCLNIKICARLYYSDIDVSIYTLVVALNSGYGSSSSSSGTLAKE